MKKTIKTFALAFVAFAAIAFIQSPSTRAASITVATGADEDTDNGSCSLTEAIYNINAQAVNESDCPAGDGAEDTIIIPAGTITLTANLPGLTESASITGAGMGSTVIDAGGGQYEAIHFDGSGTEQYSASDLTVVGFLDFGIQSTSANVRLERIEIDGVGSANNFSFQSGIIFSSYDGADNVSMELDYVYVHDMNVAAANGAFGILARMSGGSTLDASIKNTTVNNLSNSVGQIYGITMSTGTYDGSGTAADIDAVVENVTVSSLSSPSLSATGLAMTARNDTTTSNLNVDANNLTIENIEGFSAYGVFNSAAIALAGAASGSGAAINNVMTASNLIVSGNTSGGVDNSCSAVDFSSVTGGTDGTVSSAIVSEGGNLSSDSTCAPYFIHPKDQNSLANLGATLGPLADNGGIIPTRALLQGSPAIDAGITVAGLTQDARGSVRPQGLAYDSGAYESPFTTAAAPIVTSSALAETGQSRLTLAIVTVILLVASIGTALYVKRQRT